MTALNSNLVASAYRPMFLKELMELKSKDGLPGATAADYVRQRAINPVAESIESLKGLKETNDTRELMQYGKRVFENDYISIAEQIDAGQPQEEIDTVIGEMYEKTEERMLQRFERLDELALDYARKHDVPFEVR